MKINSVELCTVAGAKSQFPNRPCPEIAFAGRSNVGKSSLINTLVQRKNMAKTSSTPGKTRTINFYLVNESFFLVDLPGYGFARVAKSEKRKWAMLIEDYLKERENLRLAVLLLDIRHAPTADDRLMYQWLVHYNIPTVVVATKADKISRGRWPSHVGVIRENLNLGSEGPVIPFSSETGEGRKRLWAIIAQYVS